MTIEVGLPAYTTEPVNLDYSPAAITAFEEVHPFLAYLHETCTSGIGRLPSSHSEYPDGRVTVASFYMNRCDPSGLGTWQVRVVSENRRPLLTALVESTPSPEGEHRIEVSIGTSYRNKRAASPEESAKVLLVLIPFAEAFVRDEVVVEEISSHKGRWMGGRLVSRFIPRQRRPQSIQAA